MKDVVLAIAATVLGVWLGMAAADISPVFTEAPLGAGGMNGSGLKAGGAMGAGDGVGAGAGVRTWRGASCRLVGMSAGTASWVFSRSPHTPQKCASGSGTVPHLGQG